jgi:hypothetical protein
MNEEVCGCFSCGRSFMYRPAQGDDSGRFCSVRCREWFDAGNPAYEPPDFKNLYSTTWHHVAGPDADYMPRPMKMGPHGFIINCAGCQKEFDSRGLRCCSPACEKEARRKEELEKELKDYPFRSAKRPCQHCGGPIPNWRAGRRVSSRARFCTEKCGQKSRLGDSPKTRISTSKRERSARKMGTKNTT